MENQSNSFFDILYRVLDKSIDLAEKSVVASEPTALSLLQRFEQWLDSKLDKSSSS